LKEIIRKSQNATEIMSRFGNGMTGDFQTNGRSEKGNFANLEIEKIDGKSYMVIDSF